MITYEDECVGCPREMGCLGSSCPYQDVPHYFCDECDEEYDVKELYDYDGVMLCADCLLKQFPKIEV